MANTELLGRLQQAPYTAAQLAAKNPVLLKGEVVYESDTGRFRIGDGSTSWNGLPSYGGTAAAAGLQPVAASSPLVVNGGNAYYYAYLAASIDVSEVGTFTDSADCAMLVIAANKSVYFGSQFKLMAGVANLKGTSSQWKIYVIQRVKVSFSQFIYVVSGAIFG